MTAQVGGAALFEARVAPFPAMDATSPTDRNELRRQMRARRRAVSIADQRRAAESIARILDRQHWLRPGRRVAAYLSHGHEPDLTDALELMRRRHCRLYLPVVTQAGRGRMEFLSFDTGTPLRYGAFGIREPDPRHAERIRVRELDLILVPLVAVDPSGTRLGNGAGFYDRRLSHLRGERRWRRPRLVGIAYDFQRVTHLPAQPWDVPLDAVITERRCYPSLRLENPSPHFAGPE